MSSRLPSPALRLGTADDDDPTSPRPFVVRRNALRTCELLTMLGASPLGLHRTAGGARGHSPSGRTSRSLSVTRSTRLWVVQVVARR